jgi:hypothetical protein
VAVGAGADEATLIWSPHPPADIRGHAPASTSVKKEASAALPTPPNLSKELEPVQWKSSDYTPELQ